MVAQKQQCSCMSNVNHLAKFNQPYQSAISNEITQLPYKGPLFNIIMHPRRSFLIQTIHRCSTFKLITVYDRVPLYTLQRAFMGLTLIYRIHLSRTLIPVRTQQLQLCKAKAVQEVLYQRLNITFITVLPNTDPSIAINTPNWSIGESKYIGNSVSN